MAGLGRVQMRFNATVASVLALVGFGRGYGQSAAEEARKGSGHPIHRKFLRTQNVMRATGRDKGDFLGYCAGRKERNRRVVRLMRAAGVDMNDDVAVRTYLQSVQREAVIQVKQSQRLSWKSRLWTALGRTA